MTKPVRKWIEQYALYTASERGNENAGMQSCREIAAQLALILSSQPGATKCYPAGSCYGEGIDSQHWPFTESPSEVARIARTFLTRTPRCTREAAQ